VDRLLVQLLEEGDAPTAAGAGTAAFGQLAGHLRPVSPQEVDQFAPADVKTVANLGIQIHDRHHKW
jgi:hypothetical protein